MHILIVPTELYLPEKSPLSGIFQQHHVDLLRENDHQLGVISAGPVPFRFNFRPYPYPAVERHHKLTIYRKFYRSFLPGRFTFHLQQGLVVNAYLSLFEAYLQQEGKPDLIHAHNCIYAGAAALAIKKKYGIPYVITEHSTLYQRGLIGPSQMQTAMDVMRQADCRTVVSNALGVQLNNALNGTVLPATTIYNVLEKAFELEASRASEIGDFQQNCCFLSVGSLEDKKNHALLIRAFAQAFKGDKRYQLQLGGEGPLRKSLGALAMSLGVLDQVTFLGYLNRKDVHAAMKAADVFVLPSKVETFGVVLIEALAFGKPCIATISGGPEEIINSVNGYLVEVDNLTEMVNALQKMVSHSHDFSAENIKADLINRFGRQVFYDRLIQLYKNILKQ